MKIHYKTCCNIISICWHISPQAKSGKHWQNIFQMNVVFHFWNKENLFHCILYMRMKLYQACYEYSRLYVFISHGIMQQLCLKNVHIKIAIACFYTDFINCENFKLENFSWYVQFGTSSAIQVYLWLNATFTCKLLTKIYFPLYLIAVCLNILVNWPQIHHHGNSSRKASQRDWQCFNPPSEHSVIYSFCQTSTVSRSSRKNTRKCWNTVHGFDVCEVSLIMW